MSMSTATDMSHMVVLLLYDMHVNFQRHVIALLYRYELTIVVVAMHGGDNHVPRLEQGAMLVD